MIPGDGQRSFVLSITLTELALLLFFLLLQTASAELDEAERKQERLAESLSLVAERLETTPEGLVQLLEELSSTAEQLRQSEQQSTKLEEELFKLRERYEKIDRLLTNLSDQVEDENFIELVKQAAANHAAAEESSALRDSVFALNHQRVIAERDLNQCTSQLKNCSGRLKQDGLGYPACWADDQGRPIYIYDVTLHENSVSVRPSWPKNMLTEVHSIPGASELDGDDLALGEFLRRARPVLEWSKRQEPECRHFVTIRDSPTMSKAAFKSNLLLVENFFYKYLVPDAN